MKTKSQSAKIVLLETSEYLKVRHYLSRCNYEGFSGINNYTSSNDVREFFYRWHLDELLKKFNKPREAKMTFVTLTLPELKTIQAMFKRVDCDSETVKIQRKFYKF